MWFCFPKNLKEGGGYFQYSKIILLQVQTVDGKLSKVPKLQQTDPVNQLKRRTVTAVRFEVKYLETHVITIILCVFSTVIIILHRNIAEKQTNELYFISQHIT